MRSAAEGSGAIGVEGAMLRVAQRRFGKELAPQVVGAWQEYSAASAVGKMLSIVQIKATVLRDGTQIDVPVEVLRDLIKIKP